MNEEKFENNDDRSENTSPQEPADTVEQTEEQEHTASSDSTIFDEITESIESTISPKDSEEKESSPAEPEEVSVYSDSENRFVNPAVSRPEPAEIVYNAESSSDENRAKASYGCSFVPQAPEKRKGGAFRVCALIIAALFTLTFMVYAGFTIGDRFGLFESPETENGYFQMEIPESDKDNVSEIITVSPQSEDKKALTVNQIAEKCTPSAVGILVETETYYFGRAYKSSGVGSGFILSEDGYIATNSHVVSGASKITVVLNDGTDYEATLIGADSITDLAVVKIEAKGLPVMERGNSNDLVVGDLAVAIGTPASIELAGTVTDGIISAVDRKIDITDSYGRVIKTMTLIQTNATINPGNSGGPLINRYGQVIGINTLKLTDEFEGIGFAIPINGAISIMNQLITDGKVSDRSESMVTGNASIGIQCADITDQEAEYYGIPKGVLVIQINKNSSAASAGLRRGDIIVAYNGKNVETTEDINNIKARQKPGDPATLKVYRDGDGELEITFNLDMQEG